MKEQQPNLFDLYLEQNQTTFAEWSEKKQKTKLETIEELNRKPSNRHLIQLIKEAYPKYQIPSGVLAPQLILDVAVEKNLLNPEEELSEEMNLLMGEISMKTDAEDQYQLLMGNPWTDDEMEEWEYYAEQTENFEKAVDEILSNLEKTISSREP